MVSKQLRGVLVGATAGVLAMISCGAFAQAPGGGPPGGGGRPAMTRDSTEQRMGLTNPELKLTADQKTQVDKLVDGYVADMQKMMGGGAPDMQAFMKARQDLVASIDKVLNDDQKKIFDAAQQRRPGGGPGGGGGPRPRC